MLRLLVIFIAFQVAFAGNDEELGPPSNRYFHIKPFIGFAEPVNSITHLVAAALVIVFCPFLYSRCKDKQAFFGVSLFVFGSVFSMSISGVYHLLTPYTTGRIVLRRIDHSAIYCFIAGTFSAIHATAFPHFLSRWLMVIFMWILAIIAIVFKSVFFSRIPAFFGYGLYLMMGWCGTISGYFLWKQHKRSRPIYLLIMGGLAYTIGAVLEFTTQKYMVIIPGVIHSHEVFHFFIMAGLYYHFVCVFYCLVHFHTNYHQIKDIALENDSLVGV
ncbi:hypothetical protein RCL1_004003 [Eukaryota sp. TZLM3-RCL]